MKHHEVRRGWQTMPASLSLLALLAILASCGAQSASHSIPSVGHATPTTTGSPAPKGQWVPVAELAGPVPAIAPEDPYVVYQVLGDTQNDDGKHVVLRRSEDGGVTWRKAPNGGMPVDGAEPSILGTLSDGSILVRDTRPTGSSSPASFTLYAWKDGEDRWRRVTTPLSADGILMVTPAGTGHDTIWAVVSYSDGGIEQWVTE